MADAVLGKVWLVGAGPWDSGLFTLKGKEVLEQAEVVVYDRLVGWGILHYIPRQAECINVGKAAGNHLMPQKQINQILLEKARAGKRVVRLKGGDPFLFGRGGEELALLVENKIPFEVVPGITSAISVPAYQGIPVTHRDCASSLHIVTGHKKKDEPLDIDFVSLVKIGGTLVFMMGISALPDICQGLLLAGMRADMPLALLQQGTRAEQKRWISTIGGIETEIRGADIISPAIIMVGEVCRYGEELAWFDQRPLAGKRILTVRPQEKSSELAKRLRDLGAEVLELPAIWTRALDEVKQVAVELQQLPSYQYIVFTSPAGVRIFFERMQKEKLDIRRMGAAKIAVLGKGTRAEVEKRGLLVDFMPEVYDGKRLGELLAGVLKAGDKVLIPRAKEGSQPLVQAMEGVRGVTVVDLAIYETLYREREAILDPRAMIAQREISMVVFTSASTVKGFARWMDGVDCKGVAAACIGRQTLAQAQELGLAAVVAPEASIEGIVELCLSIK